MAERNLYHFMIRENRRRLIGKAGRRGVDERKRQIRIGGWRGRSLQGL
jgi:hypothetical protein